LIAGTGVQLSFCKQAVLYKMANGLKSNVFILKGDNMQEKLKLYMAIAIYGDDDDDEGVTHCGRSLIPGK
jgi:hypothetical protein